jgi:hypothetical protein
MQSKTKVKSLNQVIKKIEETLFLKKYFNWLIKQLLLVALKFHARACKCISVFDFLANIVKLTHR